MLNSLCIKNFRSLDDFQVSKLGRVNLIFGDNNSGKSTVLEALRIYAGNANQDLLKQIAQDHDEVYHLDIASQEHANYPLPHADLFSGRRFHSDDAPIVIGEIGNDKVALTIKHTYLIESSILAGGADSAMAGDREFIVRTKPVALHSLCEDDHVTGEGLLTIKAGHSAIINFDKTAAPCKLFANEPKPSPLPCQFISTQAANIDELAAVWDAIAFTDEGEIFKSMVRIILPEFENLAFVRDNTRSENGAYRLAKVKLIGLSHPVPLKSLGGGVLRMLQIALSLFSAKGGFLLIDEFDSHLCASAQEKLWPVFFDLARKLSIQIFATTINEDCIGRFCSVLNRYGDDDSCLFGLTKSMGADSHGEVLATIYQDQWSLDARFD